MRPWRAPVALTIETSTYAEQILDLCAAGADLHVPEIWPLEIAHALVSAQARGRIADDRIAQFLTQLFRFRIAVESGVLSRALVGLRALARLHGLTTFDASYYLELAFRRCLPLATLDLDLKKAASGASVFLLDVSS
jgi:predicted nucleic acid-binding protein